MGVGLEIFKEKAGIISKDPVWVAIQSDYLYIAPTLFRLLWLLITEWKNDRHLIG